MALLIVFCIEMMTLFHVTGACPYLDEAGKPTGHEDAFTEIAAALKHYVACDPGGEHVWRFSR